MPRYLIEFRHESDREGCVRALHVIANYGSHLMTHADFGCEDGDHVGWMIADLESPEEAIQMIPPPFRASAKVVKLRRWTPDQIEKMVKELG